MICKIKKTYNEKSGLKQAAASLYCIDGAEGARTPGLLIANQPLSQLSYSPVTASGYLKNFKNQVFF